MIERPPPPPLVGLFMLSLFVTCDLLWPVKWEFHKGSPVRRKDGQTATFVAPRPHDDTPRPRVPGPPGAMQRHFLGKRRSAGLARVELCSGWRGFAGYQ